MITRAQFLARLLAWLGGTAVVATCPGCAHEPVPGTRPAAPPQGTGCCRHRHCRYYRGGPADPGGRSGPAAGP